MSISPIEFPSISGAGALGAASPLGQVTAPQGVQASSGVSGTDSEFGSMVLDGLDRLEGLNDKADGLAVQAATGKLENIHDYTIAASEASVASQLTVALRNKAVEAFNEIMRMQV
jgi:flagellar hook-basal body complex protein FliE